ncbi:hypothetical protein BDW68DRAFT_85959 [Aspergillus falconensis]
MYAACNWWCRLAPAAGTSLKPCRCQDAAAFLVLSADRVCSALCSKAYTVSFSRPILWIRGPICNANIKVQDKERSIIWGAEKLESGHDQCDCFGETLGVDCTVRYC